MHRPAHSTNVLSALKAITSRPAAPSREPKRPALPTKDGAGLFIVGDLVLVPGRGTLARAALHVRGASTPR